MTMIQPRSPAGARSASPKSDLLRQNFRGAMRRLPSGVGIIATNTGQRWFGMTATAIASVSMDPPSLMVGINQTASIHDPLHESGIFSVNILRRDHAEIGQAFATLPSAERFTVGEWELSGNGCPTLVGAQAIILCKVGTVVPYGTHTLVIGEVLETIVDQAVDPLVFVDGTFRAD